MSSMVQSATIPAELAQERRLVTEIPGPKSRELHARRGAAVARGVSSTLPIYVSRASGGVVIDVDGNSLIDFGAGIAVVSVGNSAPRVVAAVQEQVAAFTHTCFMVAPYEGYVAVCEQLNRLTPGDHAKRSILLNSGAEAIENAVQDRSRVHEATGRGGVRPRLSRPHEPDHGAHRQGHALQERLRTFRARDLQAAHGVPVPLADRL